MRGVELEPRGTGIARAAVGRWKSGGWLFFLVIALAAVLAPVTVVTAAVVHRLLRRRPDRHAALVLAAPSAAATVVLILGFALVTSPTAYGAAWLALATAAVGRSALAVGAVAIVTVHGLLSGPAIGAAYWWVDQTWRERALVGGSASREDREREESARRRAKLGRDQQRRYAGEEDAPKKGLGLGDRTHWTPGVYQGGDLPWGRPGRPLRVPMDQVVHFLALGSSGVGKSELAHSMAEWSMEHRRGTQVIYLNAKEAAAGMEPSRRLVAHAEALGMTSRMLSPGYTPYDGFRGTDAEIRQRLMSAEVFTEPHYRGGTAVMLGLALAIMRGQGRPAADLGQVLWTLTNRDRVAQLAAVDPLAASILAHVDERTWSGAIQRYANAALQLARWSASREAGGWSWEDAQVCCVDLPTSTEPDAAQMLLRWQLRDIAAYLTHPERRPRLEDGSLRPCLLIIEELSALDDDPIIGRTVTNLAERARSARCRMVIVAQGPSGLGDDRVQDALLTSSTVITFRQVAEAERLAQLAGTMRRLEASGAYDGRIGARSDVGSARVQDTYRLRPDDLRQLGTGEAYVIQSGRTARLSVALHRGALRPDTRPVPWWVEEATRARARGPEALGRPQLERGSEGEFDIR